VYCGYAPANAANVAATPTTLQYDIENRRCELDTTPASSIAVFSWKFASACEFGPNSYTWRKRYCNTTHYISTTFDDDVCTQINRVETEVRRKSCDVFEFPAITYAGNIVYDCITPDMTPFVLVNPPTAAAAPTKAPGTGGSGGESRHAFLSVLLLTVLISAVLMLL
jgi:hypothetical protein